MHFGLEESTVEAATVHLRTLQNAQSGCRGVHYMPVGALYRTRVDAGRVHYMPGGGIIRVDAGGCII